MANKGQTFQKIPLEERLKAIKAHIVEGQSHKSIVKTYGVSKNTVKT